MKFKVFKGENKNVKKYVFDLGDAVIESVLYKYPDYETRTVLCISVQSGCPVGCTFCGTGNKFIRNLTAEEIVSQVYECFDDNKIIPYDVEKLQIMFMSMGEPFLNYRNVKSAIIELNQNFPNADLLISTIAPSKVEEFNDFKKASTEINRIGLQFSVHKSIDYERDKLIPFKQKLDLRTIRNYGLQWWKDAGRKPYLNYCIDGKNNTVEDFERLQLLFPQNAFNFTFSVVCSKEAGGFCFRDMKEIESFQQLFITAGYDTRVFDPAGQDDIGGGCGQLWYVQEWMRNNG